MEKTEARRLADETGAADSILRSLWHRFETERRPIEVDFRTLVEKKPNLGRAIHLSHPYPAKLLVSIPQFFLSCDRFAPSGAALLDPFCGSGTVPFEGQLHGLKVHAADSNPLARLITRAKLTPIDIDCAWAELESLMLNAPKCTPDIPDVVNRAHWFSDQVSDQLGRIRAAIDALVSEGHRPFFEVCFSSTVRRVSYADPRLSVPVRINPARAPVYGAKGEEVLRKLKRLETVDVLAIFWSVAAQSIRRAAETAATFARQAAFTISDNAMLLPLEGASVDLVVTSPPYVGAQKYIRASSLCLGWLGLTPGAQLRAYERLSIGREHLAKEEVFLDEPIVPAADPVIAAVATINPLRARIAQRYLVEMRTAIGEIARTLRPGGYLILVVGPNLVAGHIFDTPTYLEQLCNRAGLMTKLHLLDTIESRGLMTKRNRTAGLIAQESVFVLERSTDLHA